MLLSLVIFLFPAHTLSKHSMTPLPSPPQDPDYGEFKPYPSGKSAKPESRRAHVSRHSASQASAKAASLRAAGTADLQASQWRSAACKLSAAAEYARASAVGAASAAGVSDTVREQQALLRAVQLNEAQCRLAMDEPKEARELCSRVLERDAACVKALFRRATAALALQEYGAARADLLAAAKLEPSNRAVRAKMAECAEAAKEEKQAERRLYAAMLGAGKGTTNTQG